MKTNPQKGIRRDEFVKSVRPDPKSSEALVVLQGYIGDSDLKGHLRIYADPTLSDFIDLPEQDILYADPVETTEDPLGGSRLWVKKTAVFTAGDPAHANRVKSSFLEGDIIKAFGNTGDIPTVVRTIGNREKISVPAANCMIQVSRNGNVCVKPRTNIYPCSPPAPSTPAAGCSVGFGCTTLPACPPPTKDILYCAVGPVTDYTYPTVVTDPNVPLSAQGCTIGCTVLKDCTDLTICLQLPQLTFNSPTCRLHMTCPVMFCGPEADPVYHGRTGIRTNTYCNCAFDHHHHAQIDPRRTQPYYDGGFNPYKTGY